MIEEPGIVVAVDADGVWVATQRKTTCGSCSAKAACGQGLLNSLSADKKNHTHLKCARIYSCVKVIRLS